MSNNDIEEKIFCVQCGKPAIWLGPHVGEEYCDDCVPRYPCSCNSYPKDGDYDNPDPENIEYEKDKHGRDLPCVDYLCIKEEYL